MKAWIRFNTGYAPYMSGELIAAKKARADQYCRMSSKRGPAARPATLEEVTAFRMGKGLHESEEECVKFLIENFVWGKIRTSAEKTMVVQRFFSSDPSEPEPVEEPEEEEEEPEPVEEPEEEEAEEGSGLSGVREAAKAAGLKHWHLKSEDTLKAELEGLSNG